MNTVEVSRRISGEKPGWMRMHDLLRIVDTPLPDDEDPMLTMEYVGGTRRLDVSNVFYNGVKIGCQRTHHGKPFCIKDGRLAANPPLIIYWSERCYADMTLARNDAKTFGGEVDRCPYSLDDSPIYFIVFDDVKKLIALETSGSH